jgi:hypothetical protein
MGKSTISMAIFISFLYVYQKVTVKYCNFKSEILVFFAIPNVFEHPLAGFNLALAACRGQWTVVLSLLTQWRQGLLVSKLRCQSSGWDGSLVNLQKANWKITIFNR